VENRYKASFPGILNSYSVNRNSKAYGVYLTSPWDHEDKSLQELKGMMKWKIEILKKRITGIFPISVIITAGTSALLQSF
jgi:hypothetical protein